MKIRHALFLIVTIFIGTLPLTLGLVRSAPVLADPPSGQQSESESMQDAPPDITPYVRASLAVERPPSVRPSISMVTPSGATIRVIDTVISNTNTSLTNTDTQNDGEPSIAINPANPSEIVITAFSGSWGANTPIWH